ncbi:carboxypeptidase-like regulatory domain-containing protein, partial [Mariniblastus sp.]|nr:carboxypeptidase-like regulatory domain-containing protein [Mariniblastus sp.]
VDILHPGYQRLVGTLMSGGSPNEVSLSPNGEAEFDAKLTEALYFAGQVVDEAGTPIEGVSVASNLNTDRSSGGIERTHTDSEGRFEVHGYQAAYFEHVPELSDLARVVVQRMLGLRSDAGFYTGAISFRHDRYEDASLKKIEDLEPGKRSELLVVMQSGHSIGGVVKGADGTPARDLVISITQTKPSQRKAMRTDAQGEFRFDGIKSGNAVLRVVDVSGNRKVIEDYVVDADDTKMTLKLESFESPITQTFQALGVTVADVTEEIKSTFDLDYSQGVVVVDISDRLREELNDWVRPGDVCWMVGNDRIGDLKELVNQMVKEAKSPTIPRGAMGNTSAYIEENGDAKVRVVYSYNDDRGHGSNTQYLKLTPQDVDELEKLQAVLAKASKP